MTAVAERRLSMVACVSIVLAPIVYFEHTDNQGALAFMAGFWASFYVWETFKT